MPFTYTAPGRGGLKIYIANKNRDLAGCYDICRSIKFSRVEFQGDAYLVMDLTLDSSDDFAARTAETRLQYRIGAPLTFVRTDITFLSDDPAQFEVGMFQRYDPLNWTRQMFPTISETTERPISHKALFRYNDYQEDTSRQQHQDEQYFADNHPESNLRAARQALGGGRND